ncbi:O-fucosyltransferase 7 isoform X2 [Eucalyptus grandis]|uniref:O-fucosyltransferase 7 isoform X2 n=1 Tax=Eucalyptus grandis TaxID=71139 RepID=UPI000525FDB5|nr:O-fucosyltransferase 7 isoform X2 [Eucalyptus grandis]
MQKLRWRALVALRRLLTGAICAIALLALLSVHLRASRFSGLPGIADPRKLPAVTSPPARFSVPSVRRRSARRFSELDEDFVRYELKYQRQGTGQSWTRELAPPHFLKPPASSAKLDGANGSSHSVKLWKPPSNRDFVPCTEPGLDYTSPRGSQGYLLVSTNGGLNQMRAGICDMVAVARIINATLVIPELDKRSFWQDTSNFSDVFDEDHFINALANDIRVIRKLPEELATAAKAVKYFKSWSGMDYYQNEIASMWDEHKVIRAAKSDSRLANNNLPPDIQKLRCRACYGALRFAPKIEAMGKMLVDRMRAHGPYIALHLRYEKDMLAFSGCTHDLSEPEADELKLIRENTSHWKVKEIDPMEQRSKGYCPLTPKEVGIFLTALGYPSNTPIYIAAGEIYGGDSRMAGLRARYPMLRRKEFLASVEELQPFTNHSSQMAALDYIVSVESDVFIPSYSGNMARAVEGHRRFLGHKKTISPDRKTLVRIFDKIDLRTRKEGKKLSNQIIELHKRRQGSPRKRKGPIAGTKGTDRFRSEEPFYVNPLPDCLCHRESPSLNTSQIS